MSFPSLQLLLRIVSSQRCSAACTPSCASGVYKSSFLFIMVCQCVWQHWAGFFSQLVQDSHLIAQITSPAAFTAPLPHTNTAGLAGLPNLDAKLRRKKSLDCWVKCHLGCNAEEHKIVVGSRNVGSECYSYCQNESRDDSDEIDKENATKDLQEFELFFIFSSLLFFLLLLLLGVYRYTVL